MDEDGLGCLVFIVLAVIGFAFASWDSVWFNKLRYSLQYSADYGQVTAEPKPKDCNFMHAPLGGKDCHYEKVVQVVIRSTDKTTSRPIISFDDGKTWAWDDGDTRKGTTVFVSWAKQVD